MQADLDDLAGLYRLLLRGAWMVQLLEKIGHKKIERLREIVNPEDIDEVQIYLGYLIELKRELQLQIDIDHMRFGHPLSRLELQQAKQDVLAAVRDPEKKYKFLAKHPVWQQALERKDPEAYAQAIEPILVGDPKVGIDNLISLTKTMFNGREPDLFEGNFPSEALSSDCCIESVALLALEMNRLSQSYVRHVPSSSLAERVSSGVFLSFSTPVFSSRSGWQEFIEPLSFPRQSGLPRYVNQQRSSSSVYSHFAN